MVDDVAVSQNESVGRDQKSGAAPADFGRAASALFDVDVNNGRSDALNRANHCPRIFVEQCRIARLCAAHGGRKRFVLT